MLMHCLCTMFVRRLNFSLRPQAAYAAPYAALMQGLCGAAYASTGGLCKAYATRSNASPSLHPVEFSMAFLLESRRKGRRIRGRRRRRRDEDGRPTRREMRDG